MGVHMPTGGHCKFSRQRVRIQLPFTDPWSIRLRRCSNVAAEGEHHVLAVVPSAMARHRHRAMAGVPGARGSCRWPQRCHGKVLVRVDVLPGSSETESESSDYEPRPRTPGVDGTLFVLLFQGSMWGAPSSVPRPCRASSPVQTQPELRSYSPVLSSPHYPPYAAVGFIYLKFS